MNILYIIIQYCVRQELQVATLTQGLTGSMMGQPKLTTHNLINTQLAFPDAHFYMTQSKITRHYWFQTGQKIMFGRPQTGQREVKKGSIPTRLELKNESPVWRIIVSAHLECVINVRIMIQVILSWLVAKPGGFVI